MKPLVSICCITYNHENYIKDAIESFLMQKTVFPVEIIIGEDYSTDRTREICIKYQRKFPNKIKLLLPKKNVGAMRNFILTLKLASGKYIALCEGDDYWTNSYKLQKQVDLMEKYPEYSACCHAVQRIHYRNKKPSGVYRQANKDRVFTPEEWHKLGSMQTSLFFRSKYINNLPDWVTNAPIGSVVLRLFLSQKGKFAYINQIMSSYRIEVAKGWTQEIRTNAYRNYIYNKGMIKMYNEFDKYTNFQYSELIALKQLLLLLSEIKLGKISRFGFFKKYRHKIKKLSIRKKFIFFTALIFHAWQKKIMSWKISKIIKSYVLDT